ncbi:MAG: hypothetical protein MRY79_06055 [Alphaproteobacteria bacterium]|nr:hypothetical protein [Alphaproteobacteria bacterium]
MSQESKDALRQEIAELTAEFKSKGGEIKKCPPQSAIDRGTFPDTIRVDLSCRLNPKGFTRARGTPYTRS